MGKNLRAGTRLSVAFLALSAAACSKEAPPPATIEERGLAEFRACAVCHARTDPADPSTLRLTGPSLFGVAGAPSARLPDYDYSPAMRRAALVWDEATLDAYLAEPQAIVPGTRMSYPGEADPEARAAIIAYLKTLK
jgi:cytochrome c